MKRKDVKEMLTILQVAYPSAYKNMTKDEAKQIIDTYEIFFAEYDAEIVVPALRNYIRTNEYPPTIAGLQKNIDTLINSGDTEAELWNALYKALCNSSRNSVAEFEKLPELCKSWLGSSSMLRELNLIETKILNTVVRGEFLKSIGSIKTRAQAKDWLELEYKRNELLALEGGEDEDYDN